MTFEDFIIAEVFLLIGLCTGNYLGDAVTLRDCATKGRAVMDSGGTIICEVKKI